MLSKLIKVILITSIFSLTNAYAEVVGNFEFAGQKGEYDYWGNSYTPWRGYKIAASVSNELNENNSLQLDLKTFSLNDDDSNGYYPVYGNTGVAHYVWNQDKYDLGLFTGLLINNGYYGTGSDTNVFFGAEGRAGLTDKISVHGQAGVLDNRQSYYQYRGNITFAQTVLTAFVMEDLKLEAALGYIAGKLGDGDGEDAKMKTWGVRAEYGYLKSLSGFLEISGHSDSDYLSDSDYDSTTTAVGVSYGFGGESLKARHDNGPSMKAMNFDAISWWRLDGW